MQQVNILPSTWTLKGPDLLRGPENVTFLVAPYTDDQGRNFFSLIGGGHENLIDEDIVQALFGPELPKVMDDIAMTARAYDTSGKALSDEQGNPIMKKHWDWHEIRRRTLKTALYGRKGTINNRTVVMIWEPPANWQSMLTNALEHLKVDDDAVVTVGINNQFLAQDFLEAQKKNKSVTVSNKDQERLELLQKYHTATGAAKIALAKQLGITGLDTSYPQGMSDKELEKYPFKRPHWREKGRQHGINVFDYGESLNFRDFYDSL
jgi:hypothetical protein